MTYTLTEKNGCDVGYIVLVSSNIFITQFHLMSRGAMRNIFQYRV